MATGSAILPAGLGGIFDTLQRDAPGGALNLTSAAQAVDRVVAAMIPTAGQTTRNALLAYASTTQVLGSKTVFTDTTKLRTALGALVATAAATSEFQFRG